MVAGWGLPPLRLEIAAVRVARVSDDDTSGDVSAGTEGEPEDPIAGAQAALDEARRRVAEAPPEVVVANHVMGLYELAAIHLSAEQPNLPAASLAIDAVACLVDGLGDRLGPDVTALRDALANIRMAFVQVKSRAQPSPTAPSGGEETAPD